MTAGQLEARLLRSTSDIPEAEARAAIRPGIAAAAKNTAPPDFEDKVPF
jgi:hypothetical protein